MDTENVIKEKIEKSVEWKWKGPGSKEQKELESKLKNAEKELGRDIIAKVTAKDVLKIAKQLFPDSFST